MGEAASEMRRARADRLSELPDSILLHILSLLHRKQIVRTSVLSTRWRFLWMSVPVSLEFNYLGFNLSNFLASINNELYYWRFCEKIQSFRLSNLTYDDSYVKSFDLWVHFVTKAANVEDFTLKINYSYELKNYLFPQFAYKNTSLKNLTLKRCQLNPSVSVNWTSLLSLSISDTVLKDGVMEKVLSGCPNLEHLELYEVGIHRLEISSPKLRELIIDDICPSDGVEIIAPYILYLRLTGFCFGIHFGRNVPSLVTALLYIDFEFQHDEDKLEEECSYLRELLQSVAHVKNLELGLSCTECLSVLELEGWQFPPSNRTVLKLQISLNQLDFPGIFSFLQSSSDLETLIIDGYTYTYRREDLLSKYINEDEQRRRFRRFVTNNINCSLLHLKTIKIINLPGSLSENNFLLLLVKSLLKCATVLEKFVIAVELKWRSERSVSQDYVGMEKKFLSFPRSSPHASFVFSYR